MAMGRKRHRQKPLWIASTELPRTRGHVFYDRVNEILKDQGFDEFAEKECGRFYKSATIGRPSLAPGVYFRLLMVGYFEGIDSERGIAWRCADSLSLKAFLGYELTQMTPEHTTVSRTRRLIDVETHGRVFTWMLKMLAEHGLIAGKTIGVDGTTLEANAAMRSIVRRDTGESYSDYLVGLAQASGIETPTQEDIADLDRKRAKKGSNEEWEHPDDPDAKITKMKDGSTHLAHKAEHAVDMETGAVLAVTLQDPNVGDTTTIQETLIAVAVQIEQMTADPETADLVSAEVLAELVTDKGYHSNAVMTDLKRTRDPQLRLRAPAWETELDWQTSRTGCGLRQSAESPGKSRQSPDAITGLDAGAAIRALLRNRQNETSAFARARKYSKAAPDPCERIQSESGIASVVGQRNAAGSEGTRFGLFYRHTCTD